MCERICRDVESGCMFRQQMTEESIENTLNKRFTGWRNKKHRDGMSPEVQTCFESPGSLLL